MQITIFVVKNMVFQFGDFFNTSSSNPYLIELIRATYTIIIFFAGVWYARYRDEEKSFKDRRDLRQYIFSLVESLNKPFNAQIDSLNKLVESMRVDDLEVFEIQMVPELSMDNLKQQSDNDLFKAFVTKIEDDDRKISSFINFKSAIEYFDRVTKVSIINYFEDFYKKNQEFIEVLKTCSTGIFEPIRIIILNHKDDIAKEMGHISLEFAKKSKEQGGINNAFFTYENAVIPLLDVCDRHFTDERCSNMMKHLISYRTAISIFKRDRDFCCNQFITLIETMKEQKEKMDKSIAHLKSLKPKRINPFKV